MKLEPNKYAAQVKSGKIVAPIYIHQAIARHEADLKRTDIYFDKEAGALALQIISILRHTKGKWKGQLFVPLLWQQWVIYLIFGWKNLDGKRRFITIYLELARKNGKSTLVAAIAIVMFYLGKDEGPEIYTGATTTKQAKIVFNEARAMVLNNPELKKLINVYQHNMQLKHDPISRFEPCSREADNMDGLSPLCAIIDEYHAHKTSGIYDVFKSALGAREEPMQITITTAGFNKGAPCYKLRKTCIEILSGKKKDDSMFALVYAPDPGDDWTLQRTWKKANPSIGETISMKYLKNEFVQAKNNVGEQVNFKTKHLNIWTETEKTWIESNIWEAAAKKGINDSHLKKWKCYGALDLGKTRDITAFVLTFVNGQNVFIKPFFFVPEETVTKRSREDGVMYDTWVKEGYIIPTPGNAADFEFIENEVARLLTEYNAESMAYDGWQAHYLVTNLLARGFQCNAFSQRYSHMDFPTREIERKLYNGTLFHDGNPVMDWMIGNVVITSDSSGNIKIDKGRAAEKVDGPVGVAMGIGEWLTSTANQEEPQESVYKNRGFIEL